MAGGGAQKERGSSEGGRGRTHPGQARGCSRRQEQGAPSYTEHRSWHSRATSRSSSGRAHPAAVFERVAPPPEDHQSDSSTTPPRRIRGGSAREVHGNCTPHDRQHWRNWSRVFGRQPLRREAVSASSRHHHHRPWEQRDGPKPDKQPAISIPYRARRGRVPHHQTPYAMVGGLGKYGISFLTALKGTNRGDCFNV